MATVEDYNNAMDGAAIGALLPYIKLEIGGMIQTVMTRAVMGVRQGTLTPEAALSMWQEVHSAQRLLSRMEQRATVGIATGEKIAPEMTIGDDNA